MNHSTFLIFSILFLFTVNETSFAHQIITNNQNWCDGEVVYLNDIIHEFNKHELLAMNDYATEGSSSSQEPIHSDQPPSHDIDDDWNYAKTVMTGYCKEQSSLYSINPNLTMPIFLGPDTFFDNYIREHSNNSSDEPVLIDHHETYKLAHGLVVVCAVCRGQLTQVSESPGLEP